jgi:hypothetical protein
MARHPFDSVPHWNTRSQTVMLHISLCMNPLLDSSHASRTLVHSIPPVAVNMSMERNRPAALANLDPTVTSQWGHQRGTQTEPPAEESLKHYSALAVPRIMIVSGDIFHMQHSGERDSFLRLNPEGTVSLMTRYGWESVPKVATPLNSTWKVTGLSLTLECRCYDENYNMQEDFQSLKALTATGWVVEPPLAQDRPKIELVRCTATFVSEEYLLGNGYASGTRSGPGGRRRRITLRRANRLEEAPLTHRFIVQNAWDFMQVKCTS